MTSVVLDIICVILIGGAALTAYFKGFVKTVLEFLSVLISCGLAAVATNHFTPLICKKIVYPVISGAIGQYIPQGIGQQVAKTASATGDIEMKVMETVGKVIGEMAVGIADAAGRQISQTLAESLTRIVLFLLFFVLFSILFRVVIFVVDTVCHLPVLKMLNRLAGFSIGLVQGAVLAGLFCIAVSFFVATYQNSPSPVVRDADIKNTMVTHYIYDSSLIQPFLFE